MHCCHPPIPDFKTLDVAFDQEPTELEDGTYEVPLGAVTSVGHRSLSDWKRIACQHACTFVGAAAVCGIAIGALVTCLLKK